MAYAAGAVFTIARRTYKGFLVNRYELRKTDEIATMVAIEKPASKNFIIGLDKRLHLFGSPSYGVSIEV